MSTAVTVPLADTWGMHGDVGTGWWIVMAAFMVLFLGAVIVSIAWFLRGAAQSWPGRKESPAEILERRFAEGAISPEDYRARREALASGTAGANGGAPREKPLAASRPGEASHR
jgi:putative membrane protein